MIKVFCVREIVLKGEG